jgi:hypothetical protein
MSEPLSDRAFLAALPDEVVSEAVAAIIATLCPPGPCPADYQEDEVVCRACWEQALATRAEEGRRNE